MSYRIEAKKAADIAYAADIGDWLRENGDGASLTPRTLDFLIDSASQILHQSYEWNGENEEAMKPWYDALDALDAESFFPVTLGPTPDGVTLILHHVDDDPMVDLILVEDESE